MSVQGPLVSSNSEYRNQFPRTQREAGIEHIQWGPRVTPLRSYVEETMRALLIGILVVAALCLCLGFAR